MIQLDDKQWDALYEEVLVRAVRISAPRRREGAAPEEHEFNRATQRDRAKESTQKAFERYYRVRPPAQSIDELRRYLIGAMRSELNHSYRETHKEYEEAAVIEMATVSGNSALSAEAAILEVGEIERDRRRLERRKKMLLAELEGDALARGTVECIAKGVDDPAEQARILKCSVEDIRNARKRRSRAVERVLASETDEDEE